MLMLATSELCRRWAVAATPPPVYTVSQWADAKRLLPESSGAKGGKWRTDAVPYLRGIMDAARDPYVRQIALRKCAQAGGSEAINNIVGYFIEHDPCPILMVHPTSGAAEEYSKERLADMIRGTPALAAVVRDGRQSKRGHQSDSTLTMKMFPGGWMKLGGAHTENTFARVSARIAIGDDVDRFPPVVGQEGDPADLLVKRTETFDDGLVIMVSTPALKGGRIDTAFEFGDQRQYHVKCQRCGRWDWITWSDKAHFRVAYDERDASTARLECPSDEFGGCGARIDEAGRRRMVAVGEWEATAEPKEIGLASFHLPAMVTTLGNATLSSWVSKWLSAREKGKESTRVFINTTLGEGWEDRTVKIDPHSLMSRREYYGDGIDVPADAAYLTAGVDVQIDRFELQVMAWGRADERWVVDWRSIPGDPKRVETREKLWDALSRSYRHASGQMLQIGVTFIDTGYATDEVYAFVLGHQHHGVLASKGYGGRSGSPIVGKVSEHKAGHRPVRLYPINVDDAKADILGAVTVPVAGPGYMHLPLFVDEEYFAQLCSEHRETKYNKFKVATHQEWVKDRQRNEALDTAVLCLAAVRHARPDIAGKLAQLNAAGDARPPAPTAPVKQPWLGSRRPGGWLKGNR